MVPITYPVSLLRFFAARVAAACQHPHRKIAAAAKIATVAHCVNLDFFAILFYDKAYLAPGAVYTFHQYAFDVCRF